MNPLRHLLKYLIKLCTLLEFNARASSVQLMSDESKSDKVLHSEYRIIATNGVLNYTY